MTWPSTTVTVAARVPWHTAYDYARHPDNLPSWASGLSSGIAFEGGRWITQSPMGPVAVEMAPENPFGVLDHDVELPDGTRFHNPFRVVPAGDGCLFVFTVFQTDGVGAEAHAKDVAHVRQDLEALKALLEGDRP